MALAAREPLFVSSLVTVLPPASWTFPCACADSLCSQSLKRTPEEISRTPSLHSSLLSCVCPADSSRLGVPELSSLSPPLSSVFSLCRLFSPSQPLFTQHPAPLGAGSVCSPGPSWFGCRLVESRSRDGMGKLCMKLPGLLGQRSELGAQPTFATKRLQGRLTPGDGLFL